MVSSVHLDRDIEIRHDVDVCVLGGGPAGLAAAITAARRGSRVFLVEGQGCFGGMGTSGGLPMFCQFTDHEHFVAGAFARDVYDRMREASAIVPYYQAHDAMPSDLFYPPETLKRIYDDLVVESGVEFAFYTRFLDLLASDGHIEAVICHGKSGLFAIRASVFIDCTGDGDLCVLAGAPYEKGDPGGLMQPGTLCTTWTDIDWKRADAAGHGIWQQEQHLPKAIADGVFTYPDRHLPGMIPTGVRMGVGNIGHLFGIDGTDERSMTQAMIWGRKLALEYERFYQEYLTGYENMELAATAALPGVRETRRILGDYLLTVDDFLNRASFDDEIGRYCYPIDIHPPTPGEDRAVFEEFQRIFATYRYQPGETYGIPYRCLTPRRLHNVLVAGRCISVDRMVLGSIRVMPGCMLTGQAAGMAAAIAAERRLDMREVPVRALQQCLADAGTYLPNFTQATR